MASNGGAMAIEQQQLGKAAGRGPSYPAFTLEDAVSKAKQFWAAAKRGAAPIAAVAKHWGYSETSSSGKIAIAALLQFGLLEDQGSRDSRTVKLTGRGLDIVLDDPDSQRQLAALQDAVRAPKLYADILAKWPPHELPADGILRFYLIRDKSFNENSVDGFIKDFRASIVYAKLDKPAIIETEPTLQDEAIPDSAVEANNVVEAQGAAHGRAVAAASGTSVGAGEREWMRGTLSGGVNYRLIVSGEMRPKEIGKLIKLLEVQKAVLDEDDEL